MTISIEVITDTSVSSPFNSIFMNTHKCALAKVTVSIVDLTCERIRSIRHQTTAHIVTEFNFTLKSLLPSRFIRWSVWTFIIAITTQIMTFPRFWIKGVVRTGNLGLNVAKVVVIFSTDFIFKVVRIVKFAFIIEVVADNTKNSQVIGNTIS